jgi:ribosomal RNA-processing protein 1
MAVLEASMTSKARENMKKTPKNDNKQVKKVLVVAQELKLARVLAGNNKTARDRALKSLRKWFQNRATTIPFTENDFLRLWKGLFYSMWMSDKPLIQVSQNKNKAKFVLITSPHRKNALKTFRNYFTRSPSTRLCSSTSAA